MRITKKKDFFEALKIVALIFEHKFMYLKQDNNLNVSINATRRGLAKNNLFCVLIN